MNESINHRRVSLLNQLLQEYRQLFSDLENSSALMNEQTSDVFSAVFSENLPAIQERLEQYHTNLSRMTQLNDEITRTVNQWVDFAKSPSELGRLGFPLRFLRRGNAMKKQIRKMNEELSSITIENRFITEQVTIWEHKLETDVIVKIRSSEEYAGYEKSTSMLESVISELKYLIPSIPGLCPADVDPSGTGALMEKLDQPVHCQP